MPLFSAPDWLRNRRKVTASTKRRYSNTVLAHRGDALVERKVRPNLAAADENKFVAIDTETGEYELDKNEMKAVDRLRKRVAETDNQASPLPRLLFRGGQGDCHQCL